MINSTRSRLRTALRSTAMVAAAVGIAITGATTSEAATDSVHVSGLFRAQSDGTLRSTGDFLGTYETTSPETVVNTYELGDNTIKVIVGTDKMTGCLDLNHNKLCDRRGPRGSITMTYKRLATFDADGVFLESYCTHPITSTTGDFTGGLILMADRARDGKGGNIKSTYRGDISLVR